LLAAWGTQPADLIVVGTGGTVKQRTSADWSVPWSTLTSGVSADLTAVSGASGIAIAVGAVDNGASAIVKISAGIVTRPTLIGVPAVMLRGVHMFDATTAVAVGDASTAGIIDLAASTWTPLGAVPNGVDLRAVWAVSPADVWAAGAMGSTGIVLHWDGFNWVPMAAPVTAPVTALWGEGQRVFAATEDGSLADYDGQWHVTATATPLRAVFGSSATDVFASGDGNTLYHYDGAAWSPFRASSTTTGDFIGGTAIPHAVVFIHGSDLDVLERLAR
jgi:hypothetical protein